MKRRAPVVEAESGLPAEIAAGPLPGGKWAWVDAGQAWSRENGLGPWGWLALLPPLVKWTHMPSAAEQAAQRAGYEPGYIDGRAKAAR